MDQARIVLLIRAVSRAGNVLGASEIKVQGEYEPCEGCNAMADESVLAKPGLDARSYWEPVVRSP